jgi:glycine/D-amino acid oxidase-like deaminating enzyme
MTVKSIKIKRPELRRYLVPINTAASQQMFTDCLVIGSGIAGLRAAIEAASLGCEVMLVCKRILPTAIPGTHRAVLRRYSAATTAFHRTLKTRRKPDAEYATIRQSNRLWPKGRACEGIARLGCGIR